MNYKKLKTIIGNLHIYANETHLLGIFFDSNHSLANILGTEFKKRTNAIIEETSEQILSYLDGTLKEFNISLNIQGTEFQKKAWRSLQVIPYGTTISYQEQAINIKNEKAVRALGSANGYNLFPIIIPCHRVINKSGSLGGYSGGLEIKEKLLKLERHYL